MKIDFEYDSALVMYIKALQGSHIIEAYTFGEIHHLVLFRVDGTRTVKIHFKYDGALLMYIYRGFAAVKFNIGIQV